MATLIGTQLIIERSELMEVEPDLFVTEATTVGLPTHRWPRIIDVRGGFGNGSMFLLKEFGADGSRVYRQVLGTICIRIFNR